MRAKEKRLRHLLTIWRGVSKRRPMTSFDNPWAARRTILARITSRYGDVYLRALDSNSPRSGCVRSIVNGLCLGIKGTSTEAQCSTINRQWGNNNTSSYLRTAVLSQGDRTIVD